MLLSPLPLPPGIVAGDSVMASALALVQGGAGFPEALDFHGGCRASDYIVTGYECVEHGTRVQVVVCPACDAPVAALVESECEHTGALLEDVAESGAPL
jgi:hypothetical protein